MASAMANTIAACRTALSRGASMRRARQYQKAGKFRRGGCARLASSVHGRPFQSTGLSPTIRACTRAQRGRVLLALDLLVVLTGAWRGQWAFQFGLPRAAGGWQLL